MIARPLVHRAAIATWGAIRAGWMVIGMSVAILLLAESCYRLQDAVRTSLHRDRSSPSRAAIPAIVHPVASAEWYPQFAREFDDSDDMAWKPFVYFRRANAFHGRYINVDSLGRRVTPQPTTPSTPSARVFFFGGSTMWGSFLRDDHTIAAEASRRLQTLAGPGRRIEVTNYGETGWVLTQSMLQLILQLRAGDRPDVVVFYDGINEAFSILQNGEPGVGLNESNRAKDFALGRQLVWSGHDNGVAKDVHTFGVLALTGLSKLRLVQRLQAAVRPQAPRALPSVDSASLGVARVYTENVRVIESLAHEYGFTPIYVWQPTLHATHKQLTPFEQRTMRSIEQDAFQRRLREVHLAVPSRLDSTMARLAPGRFVNASDLFRGDTLPVFTDQVGHNTEVAIPVIVDAIWPTLKAVVERVPPSHVQALTTSMPGHELPHSPVRTATALMCDAWNHSCLSGRAR